ncbi:MAG: S8/S53 family peptidase [Bacteroidales bacterium]
MRKVLLMLFFFTLSTVFCLSQNLGSKKYFIEFTDKKDCGYSIDNPKEFLSYESLKRREKNNSQITKRDLPVNNKYVQAIQKKGFTILNTTKWFNGVTVKPEPGANFDFSDLPFVKRCQLVYSVIYRDASKQSKSFFEGETIEIDESLDENQFSENYLKQSASISSGNWDYGAADLQISSLNGVSLHKQGFTGIGVKIAVLDAGFVNLDKHPAFTYLLNSNRLKVQKDFVNPNRKLNIMDHSTHGTSVLSTMAGFINGRYIGTAPNADYYLLRCEDKRSEQLIEEYNWASAAEYADSLGIDIINSSLGYVTFDRSVWNHTYADMTGNKTVVSQAASYAVKVGMLVVNSNGNDGNNYKYNKLSAPADGIGVMSVGAVDRNLNYASFSSQGLTYDGRNNPVVVAIGEGTALCTGSNDISKGNGTSFSSPVIAGIMACFMQKFDNTPASQLIKFIAQSSSNYKNGGKNPRIGNGIPNFELASDLLEGAVLRDVDNFEFCLFPNPVYNVLFLQYDKPFYGEIMIRVYDFLGKQVLNLNYYQSLEPILIEISELSSGLYFVEVERKGKVMGRKKFIKK